MAASTSTAGAGDAEDERAPLIGGPALAAALLLPAEEDRPAAAAVEARPEAPAALPGFAVDEFDATGSPEPPAGPSGAA